jgi:hypothetical protein
MLQIHMEWKCLILGCFWYSTCIPTLGDQEVFNEKRGIIYWQHVTHNRKCASVCSSQLWHLNQYQIPNR